jgi:monoamine oxidase
MIETDVVVVGAGAAGLAAAARLQAAGVSFVLLEAKHRVGGRAFTDTSTFGVPFDRGCHWLHSASVNPLTAVADRLGFHYQSLPAKRRRLFLAGREADDATRDAAGAAIAAAFEAANVAGRAGRDVAMSEVIDAASPWRRLVVHWIGLMSSLPPEEISTLDFAGYRDTFENWPVAEGFGALVVALGAGVPVSLGVRVRAIDWSGAGVVVTTDAGDLRARTAIVTVSTTVLARGGIRFTPALPAELDEAIAACTLGHAEKIVFRFDRPIEGFAPTSYADTFEPDRPERAPINFSVNPFGYPLAVGHVGGNFSAEIARAGAAAMIDFGRAALVDIFGADIGKRILGATVTAWSADPDIGGAYSSARPGQGPLRARLTRPVGDRLRFAGEASAGADFSTAHGAHLSGLEAADWAIGRVGESSAAR